MTVIFKQNIMKNKFLILIFLTFTCTLYKSQVTDTLSYAKSFEINKANYIGQPFSKLLNDITQLQPKSMWSYGYDSELKFYNMDNSTDIGTVNLVIYWQIPIPALRSLLTSEFYFKPIF